jgi:hypothetical protein
MASDQFCTKIPYNQNAADKGVRRENMRNIVYTFFLVFLLVGCAGTTNIKANGENLFVLGTYKDGNNITEPKPIYGKYVKTEMGGFQVIQGFAGYKLFIEVITAPEQRLYSRTIVENPEDINAPFVYEHYLDPTTPRTTLTHGPVKGLEVYKDYTVTYILYENEARTIEVDRIVQGIRSYLDTTGSKLKIFNKVKSK